MKGKTAISINLRLPADLHKKLVRAAAAASPANSLNSEILSRLFESFDRATEAEVQELEHKVKELEAHAIQEIKKVQETAVIQIKRVEERAEKLSQEMESTLAKTLELQRRAEAKLK